MNGDMWRRRHTCIGIREWSNRVEDTKWWGGGRVEDRLIRCGIGWGLAVPSG